MVSTSRTDSGPMTGCRVSGLSSWQRAQPCRLPPETVAYEGTTFSRDSNVIYSVAAGALYQVPLIGGGPKKLLTNTSGPVIPAPDGSRFALVRLQDRGADTP